MILQIFYVRLSFWSRICLCESSECKYGKYYFIFKVIFAKFKTTENPRNLNLFRALSVMYTITRNFQSFRYYLLIRGRFRTMIIISFASCCPDPCQRGGFILIVLIARSKRRRRSTDINILLIHVHVGNAFLHMRRRYIFLLLTLFWFASSLTTFALFSSSFSLTRHGRNSADFFCEKLNFNFCVREISTTV